MSIIQKYLDEKSMTGVELAELAGIAQWDVSRVASGKRNASPRIAIALEKATGGDISRRELRPDIYGIAESAA